MEMLTSAQWAAVLAVVAVAYIVRGISGFGSGLIAIPLLLMMMPLTVAVPLIVVLDYLASAMQGVADRQRIVWREIIRVLPTAVIGVAAAFFIFRAVDAGWLVKVLAVFLIGIAVYQWREGRRDGLVSAAWAMPAGMFGGLVGTLFGTGGPFYVAYLQGRLLDKHAFRATFSAIFLLDGVNRIGSYALLGFLDQAYWRLLLTLLPVMVLGLLLGRRLHANISTVAFRRGISLLLVLSGGLLLFK